MNFALRVRLVGLVSLTCFGIIGLRLLYWQVGSSERLSALADAQHYSTLIIPARRGEILASDGRVLAGNQAAYFLYSDLAKMKSSPTDVASKLAPLLVAQISLPATASATVEDVGKETEANLTKLLAQTDVFWTVLYHKINEDTKNKISQLGIGGLGFESEQDRLYPESSMAAHLLGFVGSDENGNPKGYFGLEGYYDRELSGRPGERKLEKDAFNRPIPIGSEFSEPPQDGSSLVTSLDRSVQRIAQENLLAGMQVWGAPSGTVVVIEPSTGRILAIASFPSYDPANFSYYPGKLYKNPAIADVFEPGSIMKPLIMAAALNEGKLKPDTVCDKCAGPREVEGGVIRTFDNQYHPNSTMTDVLVNSDNTGMVFVGEKLGKDLLLSYLDKYQFGHKTGVDLQEEEAGTVKSKGQWYPLDLATVTFGQGIGVTALQMVRAWSVLANGGYLVTPEVVEKVISDGKEIKVEPKLGPKILSDETVKTITEMLVTVNRKSELHWPLDRTPGLSAFRIAAKSGTAQIPIAGHYEEGKTVGSVIGFAPADKPRFVLLVKLDEPAVRPWGSDTAGPIFYSIMRQLLIYYSISP